MALTETKFCLFWIVVSAVFILLSASANAGQQAEGHRCYWCGPLAEQVHRSQRASSCNGDKSKVTVCDEDLPYCAIVATSPPYIESRFCVKFYQDECYTLFCNSTKTWRITCPCRGEICNGNNTERETEAFEALLKHNVAKLTQNKRPKRGLISKAGFIGMSTKKNKIDNATEEIKDIHNDTASASIVTEDNDEKMPPAASPTEMANTKLEEELTTIHAVAATETVTETTKAEVTSNDSLATTQGVVEANDSTKTEASVAPAVNNEVKETNVMEETVKNTEKPQETIATVTEATTEKSDKKISEPSIQIDIPSANIDTADLKTEIILMSSEMPKLMNNTNDMSTNMAADTSKDQEETKMKTTINEMNVTPETTMAMLKTTEANLEKAKKSSEKLPAAEALQHNDTPTKPTEQMSTSTTTMNTHINLPTQPSKPGNNSATRIDVQILPIIIGVIMLY